MTDPVLDGLANRAAPSAAQTRSSATARYAWTLIRAMVGVGLSAIAACSDAYQRYHWESCFERKPRGDIYDYRRVIDSCTIVLESGWASSSKDMGEALFRRGLAYAVLGDVNRWSIGQALRNFDAAVQVDRSLKPEITKLVAELCQVPDWQSYCVGRK